MDEKKDVDFKYYRDQIATLLSIYVSDGICKNKDVTRRQLEKEFWLRLIEWCDLQKKGE